VLFLSRGPFDEKLQVRIGRQVSYLRTAGIPLRPVPAHAGVITVREMERHAANPVMGVLAGGVVDRGACGWGDPGILRHPDHVMGASRLSVINDVRRGNRT